jgi:streptogramin lyase
MTCRAGFLAIRIKSFKRPGRGIAAALSCLLGAGLASAASGQTITEFPIPDPGGSTTTPTGIAAGPDGDLWFTSADFEVGLAAFIGRITPAGTISEFPLSNSESAPCDITAGPDGNLWFAECEIGVSAIGRITPAGVITEFPLPTPNSAPRGITVGPDGALWFTETANKIGRSTPAGVITEFPIPTPNSAPRGITVGPDGALWFTETAKKIGRITPAGVIAEFPIPTPNSVPFGITVGPDGALWFTESTANFFPMRKVEGKIGRITTGAAAPCTPNSITLCLNSGRFAVTASWRTSTGSGAGTAGQLTGGNSGYFSFFDTSNVELVVKVLNGCALSNSYWVFAAGLTNVEVTLTVTDTQTGATRTYLSPLGTPFQPIQDTIFFATCP